MQAPPTTYLVVLPGFFLLMVSEILSHRKNSRSLNDVFFANGDLTVLIRKQTIAGVAMTASVLLYAFLQGSENLLALPNGKCEWMAIWACVLLTAFLVALPGAQQKIFNSRYTPLYVPSARLTSSYLLIRALYLIVYEIFFRGIMLESIKELTGVVEAVTLNLVFYALAHIFSSRKELIATVPFGFLLCLLTIKLQSVWPAISIHLALALSYEAKLIYHQKS